MLLHHLLKWNGNLKLEASGGAASGAIWSTQASTWEICTPRLNVLYANLHQILDKRKKYENYKRFFFAFVLDESKGLLTLVCVMRINLCWFCWSPRLWSDFSFWQVLEKSLCVPPHSKQQPVWEKEAAKNKQILRTKTFMRVHCLEISQEEREVVSHGSFLTLEDHFNKPFESCKKWLII